MAKNLTRKQEDELIEKVYDKMVNGEPVVTINPTINVNCTAITEGDLVVIQGKHIPVYASVMDVTPMTSTTFGVAQTRPELETPKKTWKQKAKEIIAGLMDVT